MTTGQKIAQARDAAGMTRQQLADACGIPFSTLMKIEQGVTKLPPLASVAKIAAALNMTVNDFVADPEPPPPKRTKRKPG